MIRNTSSFLAPLVLCLLFLTHAQQLQGQKILSVSAKNFLAADELFLLDGDFSSYKWEMKNGSKRGMLEMAKECWPSKTITTISSDEYNANPDVKNHFHLSCSNLYVSYSDNSGSSIDFFNIQKGKTGRAPGRVVYYVYADFKELAESQIGERIENALISLAYIIANYDDSSRHDRKFYMSENAQSKIESKTLYLKRSTLDEKLLNDEEKLKKAYPFKYKLIEDVEWEEVVGSRKRDALYLELTEGLKYSAVDLYDAASGLLLYSSFPWFELYGYDKIDKKFLSRLK